jgi:hypothetical protein
MFNKEEKQHQSTWSTNMLKEFRDLLLNMPVPEINFVVKERSTWISLTNMSEKQHIHFLGGLLGFKDVYFGLGSLESSTGEYPDYMGYIEILNGFLPEEQEHVPLIRGFIKKDIAFFGSVSKMLVESRILNSNKLLMTLGIHVDRSGFEDILTKNILNMKLPIETVKINQRVSFV